MCSVEVWEDFVSALHIPVRCAALHRFPTFRYHRRTFRIFHLAVESTVIGIPKETIESKWF